MHQDNLEHRNQHDLLERIVALEVALQERQRRCRERRTSAAIALIAVLTGLTLWAQGPAGPVTLQSLSTRIDLLEKRVARDEAAGGRTSPQSGVPSGNPGADASLQQLTAQIAELKQEIADARSSQSTVKAPFRVVGAGGQTLLNVIEVAPGSGKLEMKGANGKSFTAGMTNQGDAFARWDAAMGTAYIGAPPGKVFGVRLFAAGSETTTLAMTEAPDSALIAIGLHGTPKLVLRADTAGAKMGVLDDSGSRFLSNLTAHGNSGGDVEIANASGQIVAFMDANPANNEGRAVFASAGGEPLAKIGAAGPHGDVLLGGPNKTVAVWEMALTGMLR